MLMLYLLTRLLRRKVNKDKLCGNCFADLTWHFKDGKILCKSKRYYRRHND